MTLLSRRHFLKSGAIAAGVAAAPWIARSETAAIPPPDRTMRYRILGRTGLKVSEIGFGGYPVKDPGVIKFALEMGVNYFDTSNCYPLQSEITLGVALKGKRDQAILATKWCPHHIKKPPTKAAFIGQLDESLQRLQTDHVDVLFNHQMGPNDGVSRGNNFSRLDNPELWEAWETVKKAGKARFFGVSGHEGNLMEVMNHVVDSGKFDVILCRYSFMNYPAEADLIQKCAGKKVGFIAMKTLAGAKGADVEAFRCKIASYKQAALKWVLSNPCVSNLIISIADQNQVREYAAASGNSDLTRADQEILDEYRRRFSNEVCRLASDCEPFCPHHVRIADILRASMYFHEYREEKHGMAEYASIPSDEGAQHCAGCSAPCERFCPHDLPVQRLLLAAHSRLTPATGGA